MKIKAIYILIFLTIGIPNMLFAQEYQIDLSQVKYPTINKDFNMGDPGSEGKEIEVNNLFMTIGGKAVLPVMGEFHFSRYDHRYWKETLLKMRTSGVDIVSSYVFWIYHEEVEGQLDWTGNNNLRKFVQLCDEVGLLVHLRVGPYINAECRNGGFPDWIMKKRHIRKRYNDPLYLEYVGNWYKAVYGQIEGLLYKNEGPIMAIQLENEYVTKGHVVPHLLELKSIAIEVGFDVPLYTMTHWMSTDYPKKEVIPYAGYYVETPWSAGYDELPVSNFEYFSYNRISDNIGTGLITIEGGVQSLNSNELESPYFTCEVGLGTPTFNRRRPIVPEEMAGANVNLRLGCGVNLMGYFMYSGGSHQIGKLTTFESSTSRVSYDYQAPLKEFGTIGTVMNETKKLNYYMNDFGTDLAQMVAYLPISNDDTNNLQWAVRSVNNSGFLFCSNYLYKKSRNEYTNVQFQIDLENEKIAIPRKPVTIVDGAYFTWPFNMKMEQSQLKYATTQPICKLLNEETKTWVFFQDDAIPAEYFFNKEGVKKVAATSGKVKKEKKGYFISDLEPGTNCVIEIEQDNGTIIKILTLSQEQSDQVWKVENNGIEYLALSKSGVFVVDDKLTLFSEEQQQSVLIYPNTPANSGQKDGVFTVFESNAEEIKLTVELLNYRPMEKSDWIQSQNTSGKSVISNELEFVSVSEVEQATLRLATSQSVSVFINDVQLKLEQNGNYQISDLKEIQWMKNNSVRVESKKTGLKLIAEIELLLKNGSRFVWNTDNTWETGAKDKIPVIVLGRQGLNDLAQFTWKKEDRIAYYELKLPKDLDRLENEYRLQISFTGNRADAFIGNELFSDYLFDGTKWVIGINRFKEKLVGKTILLRIIAFKNTEPEIYVEKYVDRSELDKAQVKGVELKSEYRFQVLLK